MSTDELGSAPSCSMHTAHVHENSAVSGVFYVRVPARSGAISFEVGCALFDSAEFTSTRVLTTAPVSLSPQDPRGTRPPFARNRLHHAPVAGELLLFPPWLVHGVAPSCEMARVRVVDCLG